MQFYNSTKPPSRALHSQQQCHSHNRTVTVMSRPDSFACSLAPVIDPSCQFTTLTPCFLSKLCSRHLATSLHTRPPMSPALFTLRFRVPNFLILCNHHLYYLYYFLLDRRTSSCPFVQSPMSSCRTPGHIWAIRPSILPTLSPRLGV